MSRIVVNTWYDKDTIQQSVAHDDDSDVIKSITKEVLRLKEQGVIDALIKLGWTPPKGVYGSNEHTNKAD